jgi:hypothetical protein
VRPGDIVVAAGNTLEVDYANFFVNATDAYMDVGQRAA